MENIDFLIKYLLDERGEKQSRYNLTDNEKDSLFRALCNIREPKKATNEFYKKQDEYLKEFNNLNGIIEITDDYKIKDNNFLFFCY